MMISLVITVFSFLLFVDYEWCQVLFYNNTVTIFLKIFFLIFFPDCECCRSSSTTTSTAK